MNRNIEEVKSLLKQGCRDVNGFDGAGRTALHYAARDGFIQAVKLLLQVDGINVNANSNEGDTAVDDVRYWYVRHNDAAYRQLYTKVLELLQAAGGEECDPHKFDRAWHLSRMERLEAKARSNGIEVPWRQTTRDIIASDAEGTGAGGSLPRDMWAEWYVSRYGDSLPRDMWAVRLPSAQQNTVEYGVAALGAPGAPAAAAASSAGAAEIMVPAAAWTPPMRAASAPYMVAPPPLCRNEMPSLLALQTLPPPAVYKEPHPLRYKGPPPYSSSGPVLRGEESVWF